VLTAGTLHTATLSGAIQDAVGNPLGAPVTWTFTTAGLAPDVTAPTVSSNLPEQGELNVPFGASIFATFSEPMAAASLIGSAGTFTLTGALGATVDGEVSYDVQSNTAIFTPDADLEPSTLYTASLSAGATDVATNPLTPFSWTFTTGLTPPPVLGFFPRETSTHVSVDDTVRVAFSAAMALDTIDDVSFLLSKQESSGAAVRLESVRTSRPQGRRRAAAANLQSPHQDAGSLERVVAANLLLILIII
jgi:Big-like domain-containing protein